MEFSAENLYANIQRWGKLQEIFSQDGELPVIPDVDANFMILKRTAYILLQFWILY